MGGCGREHEEEKKSAVLNAIASDHSWFNPFSLLSTQNSQFSIKNTQFDDRRDIMTIIRE
jgi:hypothetical protein